MTITKHEGSALAIAADQADFSQRQVAALAQIGVEHASQGDLSVFFHVCQRSGLDPFAKQIYMIGRNGRELVNGEWQNVVKQTIQTGIDGFRLIGRRAADRAKHAISVSAPEWAHDDGGWRPVWRAAWGQPVAARVTIHRNGEPFVAVALFDEYKQTKRDGGLTQMWQQRPAGQIAKCAEALAWRLAFPQDLSGIYADVEMDQADNATARTQQPTPGTGADRARDALGVQPRTQSQDGSPEAGAGADRPEGVTPPQIRKLGVLMRDAGLVDRDDALAFVAGVIGRAVESRNDLTKDEASRVIDALERQAVGSSNVVDAELVDEPLAAVAGEEPPSDGESSLSGDELWQQIVTTGAEQGMSVPDLEDDFAAQMGGLISAEASGAELQQYLDLLVQRSAA